MTDFSTVSGATKIQSAWANYILHHAFEKPCTYIIRINGSYYEVIKGGTATDAGTILYGGADDVGGATGTSAQSVWSTLLAAASAGESIYVKTGDYSITSALTAANPIEIRCDPPYLDSGTPKGARLYTSSAIDILTLVDYCQVTNLVVNGQGSSNPTGGIDLSDARYCTIRNCTGHSFANAAPFRVSGYCNTFINCIALNNKYGYHLYSGSSYNPNDTVIMGGRLNTNVANASLVQVDAGDTLTMWGTDFESATQDTICGVYVDSATSRMKLANLRFEGQSAHNMQYAFNWNAGQEDIISGCSFVYVGTVVNNKPASSRITNCPCGYLQRNSGSDSIASGTTSKAVAHGLDVTPAAEDFTIIGKENPTNSVGTIWIDTIGATNFTVNVENDPGASNWDFGWRVDVI